MAYTHPSLKAIPPEAHVEGPRIDYDITCHDNGLTLVYAAARQHHVVNIRRAKGYVSYIIRYAAVSWLGGVWSTSPRACRPCRGRRRPSLRGWTRWRPWRVAGLHGLGCGFAKLDGKKMSTNCVVMTVRREGLQDAPILAVSSIPGFIMLSTFLSGPGLCLVVSMPPCS